MSLVGRVVAASLVALAALASASPASPELEDEQALAERFAPVVRLVEQEEECVPGEPYLPIDLDRVLREPTVALRGMGPSSRSARVRSSAPSSSPSPTRRSRS